MKIRNLIFFVMALLFTVSSCKKRIDYEEFISEKAVLIYIAANNNLHYDALQTVNKIVEGASDLNNNHALLIYLKTQSSSALLKISSNRGNIVIDTLRKYTYGNSSDPAFLSEIISTAKKTSPAKSYGLVLWSHATSWAPPASVSTKSFGSDDFFEMDIKDMKAVLPDDLEYIMFDACSMASLEVCFELKDKAKYILASPAEVLSTSFPYNEILLDLFNGVEGLKITASKFINYYKEQSDIYASATVSLVETAKLSEIAKQTKLLLDEHKPAAGFNINRIQTLDFDHEGGVGAYDFLSFIKENYSETDYKDLQNAIEQTVLYKNHTASFFNVPIKTYSGLSIYIPSNNDPYKSYYQTLVWSQLSNWISLF